MFVSAENHPTPINPEVALAKLHEGNARFVNNTMSTAKPTAARRAETAHAQHPFAIVLACADSRVAPEIVFDQNIGDLFVIRNAGNLVDDHVKGSIEFAVQLFGVRLVVVVGHEECGAVTAALAGPSAPARVQSLVRDIQPAVQAVKGKPGDPLQLAVAENARLMAEMIRKEAEFGEAAKDVRIVSAVYDLHSGKVTWKED